jgi:hypothetical protein
MYLKYAAKVATFDFAVELEIFIAFHFSCVDDSIINLF